MRTERRIKPVIESVHSHKRFGSSHQADFDIEFECQSGNFSDCIENMTDEEESLADECQGILMFSNKTSTCGAYCDNDLNSQVRSNKIIRQGWTLFSR